MLIRRNAMPMSHDRIKFSIPLSRLNVEYRKILKECFGITDHELPSYLERSNYVDNPRFTIICRPSQFGRFIVLRNKAVCDGKQVQNDVKTMEMEILPPCHKQRSPIVEVWDRPNKMNYRDDYN